MIVAENSVQNPAYGQLMLQGGARFALANWEDSLLHVERSVAEGDFNARHTLLWASVLVLEM